MQIIVKGHQGLEVPEDLEQYIHDKIGPVVLKHVQEPTICEVVVADENGPKGGIDKGIRVTCTLPKVKNPVHVELVTEDYFKSVDLVSDKLQRALHKARL